MYSRNILRAFETFWLLSNYNPSSIALTNSVRSTRMHLKGSEIYLECTTIATASVIQAVIQLQSQCIWRRYKIFWLYLNRILSVCIILKLYSIFIVDQLYLKCTKIETYLKHIHTICNKIILQICDVLKFPSESRSNFVIFAFWLVLFDTCQFGTRMTGT